MIDSSLLKAFFTLLLLIAGLGGLLIYLKRNAAKSKKFSGEMDLQILSKISVLPKSHLFIVKAGERTLLLGVSDHNINTLADLSSDYYDENTDLEEIKKEINKKSGDLIIPKDFDKSLSFSSFLKNAFKRNIN